MIATLLRTTLEIWALAIIPPLQEVQTMINGMNLMTHECLNSDQTPANKWCQMQLITCSTDVGTGTLKTKQTELILMLWL